MTEDKPLRGFKLFLHFLWNVPLGICFIYWAYQNAEAGKWLWAIIHFSNFVICVIGAYDHIDDYIDEINWSQVFWSVFVTVFWATSWHYDVLGMMISVDSIGFWMWTLSMAACWQICIWGIHKSVNPYD